MKTLRSALAGLLALFVASAAVAQTFPNVPAQTVIGRLGTPGTTGASQAIPFATLSAQLNTITSAVTPINSCTDKALIYDSAGKITCLTTANNGVLVTSSSGTPSISSAVALNGAVWAGTGSAAGSIWARNDQDSLTSWQIRNQSSGSGATAAMTVGNNIGTADFICYSSTFASIFTNRCGIISGSLLSGLLFTTSGAGTIDLAIANSKVGTVTSTYIGSVIAGTAANPSLVAGSAGYGFYQPGVNQFGMSVGGAVLLDYGITTASTFTLGAGFIGQNKIVSTFATGGVGYATGAGSSVIQGTSRTTGVTINNVSGAITLFAAAPTNYGNGQSFTVTNSAVAATDTIILSVKSSNAANKYVAAVTAVAAGSFEITVFTTVGTTSDSAVINFAVIKAVAN